MIMTHLRNCTPTHPVSTSKRLQSPAVMDAKALTIGDPDLYINRELSLLEFNRRVLEQAKDESNPLLERLKFLCIASRMILHR